MDNIEEDPEFEAHQIDHDTQETESSASGSNFDSDEEPDESDPYYR